MISGWLISPPMFAALAIRPMVTTDSSSTTGAFQPAAADGLGACHNPNHATTPAASMKISASSAAPWGCWIKDADTPGRSLSGLCAEYPVIYDGSDNRAGANDTA